MGYLGKIKPKAQSRRDEIEMVNHGEYQNSICI
jgi:hypothetical protein